MIFDYRLKVFYTVAKKLSFTKAANELFISQPAVTKHINELESQLQVMLFKRNGNFITLTPAGEVLERHALEIFRQYTLLENELAVLQNQESGSLCIGASTTLAQYVLPLILARFKKTYPLINFTFISGNSGFIEQQVINQKVDIALVEGNSHKPQISYEPFANDEIVMVTKTASKLGQQSSICASIERNTSRLKRRRFWHIGCSPESPCSFQPASKRFAGGNQIGYHRKH